MADFHVLNRDKKQTLAQNYRRLGLASRLNGHTGGVDKRSSTVATSDDVVAVPGSEVLDIKKSQRVLQIAPREVRIERDPNTGAILRVLDDDENTEEDTIDSAAAKRFRPLSDPLNTLDASQNTATPHHPSGHVGRAGKSESEFLKQLEKDAARPGGKKIRKQSEREAEWCRLLYEKHGENWKAMVRDAELNVMQQSEGDLKRRIGKWMKDKDGVVVEV